MSRLDELKEQEEILERERMECLEADNNRLAKAKEKQLWKVRDLIKIEEGKQQMQDLRIYKEYIEIRNLEKDFMQFYKNRKESEDKL